MEPPELLSEDGAAFAVEQLFDRWTECLRVMPECDAVAVSGDYIGEFNDRIFVQAKVWADEGFRFENTESRAMTIEEVALSADGSTASVRTCEVNPAIQLNAAGMVVDDTFTSSRREWTLVNDGSRWIASALVDLEFAEGEGNVLCT